MPAPRFRVRAVLFDLDGTFADTAPDLTYALNLMRAARSLPPVPIEHTRPVTSTGARGMLRVGFGLTPEHPDYARMKDEFLSLYEANVCRDSSVFPGTDTLVRKLALRNIVWGIVTNKATRYARPLVTQLTHDLGCACVIGGDSTPHLKPHPAPLFAGAEAVGVPAAECAYVGDDERDVAAGRAAGMRTVAVRYGYLNGGDPDAWGANAVIDHPEALLDHLA